MNIYSHTAFTKAMRNQERLNQKCLNSSFLMNSTPTSGSMAFISQFTNHRLRDVVDRQNDLKQTQRNASLNIKTLSTIFIKSKTSDNSYKTVHLHKSAVETSKE